MPIVGFQGSLEGVGRFQEASVLLLFLVRWGCFYLCLVEMNNRRL